MNILNKEKMEEEKARNERFEFSQIMKARIQKNYEQNLKEFKEKYLFLENKSNEVNSTKSENNILINTIANQQVEEKDLKSTFQVSSGDSMNEQVLVRSKTHESNNFISENCFQENKFISKEKNIPMSSFKENVNLQNQKEDEMIYQKNEINSVSNDDNQNKENDFINNNQREETLFSETDYANVPENDQTISIDDQNNTNEEEQIEELCKTDEDLF